MTAPMPPLQDDMPNDPQSETARRSVEQFPSRAREASDDPRRQQFLLALLSGARISKACETAGIARSTGLRWRRDAEFAERLREARRQLLESAITQLHTHAADFVAVLHRIATNSRERGNDRVLACRAALDHLFRGAEVLDVSQHLEALEKQDAEVSARLAALEDPQQ